MKPLDQVAAGVFGVITSARNSLFDCGALRAYRSALPVICVGNMTVGGTGKSPLVQYTATICARLGFKPVIVSRGYGGTEVGPHLITSADTWERVGDEALMHARSGVAPVVIARLRAEAARYIQYRDIGDLIILDDGFQHRYLARNLDLVTIDVSSAAACEAFIKGSLLPLGIFRENRERAAQRASAFVLSSRSTQAPDAGYNVRIKSLLPTDKPVFRSFVRSLGAVSLDGKRELAPQPVAVFSGIAQPEGFLATLQAAGYSVEFHQRFPDHHPFSEREIETLLSQAGKLPLVCTEKDGVKFESRYFQQVFKLRMELVIEPRAEFEALIKTAIT